MIRVVRQIAIITSQIPNLLYISLGPYKAGPGENGREGGGWGVRVGKKTDCGVFGRGRHTGKRESRRGFMIPSSRPP